MQNIFNALHKYYKWTPFYQEKSVCKMVKYFKQILFLLCEMEM